MGLKEAFIMNIQYREQWLSIAAEILIDELFTPALNRAAPPMKFSISEPKAATKKGRVMGTCWNKDASADSETFNIFITASLGAHDSSRVLDILIHEMAHAYDGNQNGHNAPFAKICTAVGLMGGPTKKSKSSFTATVATPELKEHLTEIIETIGEFPHAALNPAESGKTTQTNRQLLMLCTNVTCGFKFRTSQKWLDAMQSPQCLCCTAPMIQEEK